MNAFSQLTNAKDPTIAEYLKSKGYTTAQYGKNHLGDRDEHLPTNHGFDEFFGNLYHLNAEEEPENEDYPGDVVLPDGRTFREAFGPRGSLLIPMYSTSIKKQIANPKKAYSIDNGLARANSLSFSEDRGRMLENAVFQHIRRAYHDIMYHKTPNSECDFIIREQDRILMAIQACWQVNEDNIQREVNGIKNAMKETKARKGIVVTFDQEDQLDGIKLIPAWKWLQSVSFGE